MSRSTGNKLTWPTATLSLIACNVLMFGAQQFMEPSFQAVMALRAWKLDLIAWFTSMFMHADWWHLGVNMVFLWIFGLFVEARFGWFRLIVLYVASGVGASLIFLTVHWGEPVSVIGASGAIAGLMGICLVAAPFGKLHIIPWHPVVMFIAAARNRRATFYLPLVGWVVLWVFSQVVFVWLDVGGVAYTSHFGGIGAGIILGLILRARVFDFDETRPEVEIKVRRERFIVQVAQAWSAKTASDPPVDYRNSREANFDEKPVTYDIPITSHDLED